MTAAVHDSDQDGDRSPPSLQDADCVSDDMMGIWVQDRDM